MTKPQKWWRLSQFGVSILDEEVRREIAERLRRKCDTSKKRKARKERARMLTMQREAELKAQGKWKGR